MISWFGFPHHVVSRSWRAAAMMSPARILPGRDDPLVGGDLIADRYLPGPLTGQAAVIPVHGPVPKRRVRVEAGPSLTGLHQPWPHLLGWRADRHGMGGLHGASDVIWRVLGDFGLWGAE
jgi:hypothetical protein